MNDSRMQTGRVLLLAATGLALYLCWLMLQPFLDVLLWSIVLVIVFWPVQRMLVQRTGRPTLSAAISCLVVLTLLLVPLGFIILTVVSEVADLARSLPDELTMIYDRVAPHLELIRPWAEPYINLDVLKTPQFYAEQLWSVRAALSQRTLGLVTNLAEAALKVIFVTFTMFYLFQDGPRMAANLRQRLPLREAQAEAIFVRAREVIDASVHGVLVIAGMQGALGTLAFWVLGLPVPFLWGLALTVMATIPMAGSFLVWMPACAYLLITGAWVNALLMAIWCGLVLGGLDNFLRPRLVGRRAQLHELFIFFSVLGGLQVFGILGLVLGPVVLAITIALLEVLRESEPGAEPTPEETASMPAAEAVDGAVEQKEPALPGP